MRVQIPSAAPKLGQYKMKPEQRERKQKYQRDWMRSRRSQWIHESGPCRHCGTWDLLEVDHINPSLKTMEASNIWSRTKEVRDKELTNCQVLCKSCHLKKTLSERKKPQHGTAHMYSKHKCRCEPCKNAYSIKLLRNRNLKKYKELYDNE